jgi:hypothetical protein
MSHNVQKCKIIVNQKVNICSSDKNINSTAKVNALVCTFVLIMMALSVAKTSLNRCKEHLYQLFHF